MGSQRRKTLQVEGLLENAGKLMALNVSTVITNGGGMWRGREEKWEQVGGLGRPPTLFLDLRSNSTCTCFIITLICKYTEQLNLKLKGCKLGK